MLFPAVAAIVKQIDSHISLICLYFLLISSSLGAKIDVIAQILKGDVVKSVDF